MIRTPRHCATLLVLALLVTLLGCGLPLKPKQMNNRMARSNERMAKAAKEFYVALEPLSKGQEPSGSLNGAYVEVREALKEANDNFTDVLPPNGSAPGADLLKNYQAFLVTQQVIFDRYITPMYNTAQKTNVDAITRWREIYPLLSQASNEESTAMQQLSTSHQAFCKHHMLEPK